MLSRYTVSITTHHYVRWQWFGDSPDCREWTSKYHTLLSCLLVTEEQRRPINKRYHHSILRRHIVQEDSTLCGTCRSYMPHQICERTIVWPHAKFHTIRSPRQTHSSAQNPENTQHQQFTWCTLSSWCISLGNRQSREFINSDFFLFHPSNNIKKYWERNPKAISKKFSCLHSHYILECIVKLLTLFC